MAKQYDEAFKKNALEYRKNHQELSVTKMCKNLGISTAIYYRWYKAAQEGITSRGSGNYESDEAKEIVRLKRELQAKDDALRILKKAIGILGEEPK